jgi:hypothetical protein
MPVPIKERRTIRQPKVPAIAQKTSLALAAADDIVGQPLAGIVIDDGQQANLLDNTAVLLLNGAGALQSWNGADLGSFAGTTSRLKLSCPTKTARGTRPASRFQSIHHGNARQAATLLRRAKTIIAAETRSIAITAAPHSVIVGMPTSPLHAVPLP